MCPSARTDYSVARVRTSAVPVLIHTLGKQRQAVSVALIALVSGCQQSPEDKTRLSTHGLYSDLITRTTVPEAIEYEPDYPLWSDGVQKRRWLVLPAGTQIDTSDMAHWQFPVGTKLFKEFSVRGKLLETRLVERISSETGNVKTDFFMGTFVWSADQSDAVLTDDGVPDVLGTEHDVPVQTACVQCHRGEPGGVLGVSAIQLSRSGTLDLLAKRSLLSVEPGRTFPIPGDEIQVAAVGYMNANCGHCHSADGIADQLRLRFLPNESDLPIEESEIYKTSIAKNVTDWKVHPDELQERVVPGDPEHSALLYRMLQRGTDKPAVDDQMPPIATEKVHHEGVAAVQAWIATMRSLPVDRAESADSRDDSADGAQRADSRGAPAGRGGSKDVGGAGAHAIAGSKASPMTNRAGSGGGGQTARIAGSPAMGEAGVMASAGAQAAAGGAGSVVDVVVGSAGAGGEAAAVGGAGSVVDVTVGSAGAGGVPVAGGAADTNAPGGAAGGVVPTGGTHGAGAEPAGTAAAGSGGDDVSAAAGRGGGAGIEGASAGASAGAEASGAGAAGADRDGTSHEPSR
jgi:hypothetical protein